MKLEAVNVYHVFNYHGNGVGFDIHYLASMGYPGSLKLIQAVINPTGWQWPWCQGMRQTCVPTQNCEIPGLIMMINYFIYIIIIWG